MSEEPRSWKERRFFNLNINPKEAMSPDDPASTLFNLETNPAAYPEPAPGEAPTTPAKQGGAQCRGRSSRPRESARSGSGTFPGPSAESRRPDRSAGPATDRSRCRGHRPSPCPRLRKRKSGETKCLLQSSSKKQQGAGMPQVNPNLLAGDDYVYEMKPKEEKKDLSQQSQSGGMSSQFEIVSSGLNRNN